jgi:hypothetical protein
MLAVSRTMTASVARILADGIRFVAELRASRRRLIDNVVSRMTASDQPALGQGLEAF